MFVTAHQDVGPAVHQHDRVGIAEMCDQRPVGRPQWTDTGARERVHGRLQILRREPLGERPFGKEVAAQGAEALSKLVERSADGWA